MNAIPVLSLALLFSFALQQVPPSRDRQEQGEHSKDATDAAGALFAKNCSQCHFLPDAKEPTDLAWLSQVTETS